jgi:8-oxo-dGTP diphosphatase
MKGYNVILIYNKTFDQLLMCKRRKDPYKGLNNLIGGKIEPGEDGLAAAYRELFEETGISNQDVALHHFMDFVYHLQPCYLEAYVGKLQDDIAAQGEENELFWTDLNHDFFDMRCYAGEGNIGHMLAQVNLHKDEIFKEI